MAPTTKIQQATSRHSPDWLNDAVFYEIYPQSFADSNGDGIGDIPGITSKLDYVKALGCNALWINPCFDSPFKDAGYDVRDYRKVAPRYGTNDDLKELFDQAHERGIHVLLDLVPGHTSEEHAWFKASCKAEHNDYSDRYIWTNGVFDPYTMPFISGEAPRDAAYILNFFKCQPALNYGFAKRDRDWQVSPDSSAAQATRDAMVGVMRFWLSMGCDGFRVDMADSLVKNDGDDKSETIKAWQEMLGTIKTEFPESAFVSEWGRPQQSLKAGFDMDFYLDWRSNGYNLLARNADTPLEKKGDLSYFAPDSGASVVAFLKQYQPQYDQARDEGYFCFITCNHDTPRYAPRLDEQARRLAFGMLMTMPGVPFVYYGDEIGMRYRDIPTKEGGYHRTGTRTPMQWNGRHDANLGFSSCVPEDLYLPVDPTGDAPNVADQEGRSDSMLAWCRQVLALRHRCPALRGSASFQVVAAPEDGRTFAYLRGGSAEGASAASNSPVLVAMNPGRQAESIALPDAAGFPQAADGSPEVLISSGNVSLKAGNVVLGPQSFALLG